MAHITGENIWRDEVYQYETTDPVLGGDPLLDPSGEPTTGWAVAPVKQLTDRTVWLRDQVERTQDGELLSLGVVGTHERSCVLSAPIDSASFLPEPLELATSSTLKVKAGTVMTFGFGYADNRPLDYLHTIDTDVTITPSGITSSVRYIVAEYTIASNTVAYTLISEVLEIGYKPRAGGPTGNIWYWFNLAEYQLYKWNNTDSEWNAIPGIVLGKVSFNSGGSMSDLDLFPLRNATRIGGMPIGSVVAFAGPTSAIEDGWLLCNGAAINRENFAALYAKIGLTYGGSGANFNLPDLRGVFIRGQDNGGGYDSGRTLGSLQQHAIQDHTHAALFVPHVTTGTGANSVMATHTDNPSTNGTVIDGVVNSTANVSTETRPINISMNYIIKYL